MESWNNLLFAFTEWLRTTPLLNLSLSLSNSAACQWLQSHFFAIPILQTIHILAIAILFGSSVMINMQILGLTGRTRTLAQTFERFQPWIWSGLITLIVTGVLLVVSEPIRNMINPYFWIKMTALLIAILLSFWFQGAVRARAVQGGAAVSHDGMIRTGAVLLIILWCVVMAGGRWIAYAPV